MKDLHRATCLFDSSIEPRNCDSRYAVNSFENGRQFQEISEISTKMLRYTRKKHKTSKIRFTFLLNEIIKNTAFLYIHLYSSIKVHWKILLLNKKIKKNIHQKIFIKSDVEIMSLKVVKF